MKSFLLRYISTFITLGLIQGFTLQNPFALNQRTQRMKNKHEISQKILFVPLESTRARSSSSSSFLKQTFKNEAMEDKSSIFSYGDFAKKYPFVNNIAIATMKTAAADLLAQIVIAHTPIDNIDWQRAFLFCAFGAIYLGGFQYAYQVNVFKKLFDVDRFTNLSWEDKLKDEEGLKGLLAQTMLDLTVLTLIYLPTFYIFKAGVFSGSMDPAVWWSQGIESYTNNFQKDELDLIRVWAPADIVCFSVPLYLRLPVRHIVSFVWTAYLSFARGGH